MVILALAGRAAMAAEETELRDLLGTLSKNCALVWGSADVPKAVAGLRRWTDPVVGESLSAEQQAMLNWVTETLKSVFSGPVVAGGNVDASITIVFVGTTKSTQAELLERLNQRLSAKEQGGVIKFGAPLVPWGYLAVRHGRIYGSSTLKTLRRLLASQPGKSKSILAMPDAVALLARREVQDAAFFVFKPAGVLRLGARAPQRPRPDTAARERLSAAVSTLLPVEGPSLATLHLGERSIALKDVTLRPRRNGTRLKRTVRVPRSAMWPHLAAACPVHVWTRGTGFASGLKALERFLTAFDRDMGAEFREEMAELNRDLGYGFERDLLGSLGPQWLLGFLDVEPTVKPAWVFACGLRDRDKLIKCAARLAKLAEEPWTEEKPYQGARRFRTRAFEMPLAIGVTDDALVMASSSHAFHRAIDLILKRAQGVVPVGEPETAGPRWAVRAAAKWGALARLLPAGREEDAFRGFWSKLPRESRLVFECRSFPDRMWAEIRIEGFGPEEIRTWVGPFRRLLNLKQEKGRNTICKGNLKQILMACINYEKAKAHWPLHLRELLPDFVWGAEVFQCPSAPKRRGPDGKPLPSYRYLGGLDSKNFGSMTIVIYDLKGNHPDGRNVGYLDGHVVWRTEARFKADLARCLEELKQAIAKAKQTGKRLRVNMKEVETFYHDRTVKEK